ncbi:MAG: hypothetical protein LBR21_07095 [Propionibacteriaceae bacterium]|nr:hypothetical protein [Propionibacteriaceae bacterium]
MSAPALVLVALRGSDPQAAAVIQQLCEGVKDRGVDFHCHALALDLGSSHTAEVLERVSQSGAAECVFVPLGFHNGGEADPEIAVLNRRAAKQYPEISFTVSRPLGPEAILLKVLDSRMRHALAHAHCLDLDGLVLATERSGDRLGTSLLARRVRQWSTRHHLPCVSAVADDPNSMAQAIMSLRAQGRRHIAVGSLYLTPSSTYQTQRELAFRYGAITVSDPVGACEEVVDLILARYSFAAFDLLTLDTIEEREEPVVHLRVVGA